jgi:two-component system sensor kinase FixL
MHIAEAGTSHAAPRVAQTAPAHAGRMATLAEVTATIAHEVNQPLAAIVMSAEAGLRWLVRDDLDIAKVGQIMRLIVSNARRAGDIVQGIRRMATMDGPELRPIDLNEVVEEALLLVRSELEASSISLSVTLGPDLPVVLGNRIQLQQVIVNLLVNSIQALAQAGKPMCRITLDTGVDENGAVFFSVRDSGPGIAEGDFDRVFDSFFTTKKGGMGIGLAICQSIITAHGGSIAVSNHPEGGALFQFSLPAMRSSLRPGRRGRQAKAPRGVRLVSQAAVEGAREASGVQA